MANRIQLRRGTAAQWTAANPVLAQGEPGVESDTGKMKFGNGVTTWSALPYASKGDPGAQGPAGVADDASVEDLITTPGTATATALNATIGGQIAAEAPAIVAAGVAPVRAEIAALPVADTFAVDVVAGDVFSISNLTGKKRRLTYGLTFTDGPHARGSGIVFTTAANGTQWIPYTGGDARPTAVNTDIMAGWGSSTVQGLATELAAMATSRYATYYNGGVGGQLTQHITARLGSRPLITAGAVTIPASGVSAEFSISNINNHFSNLSYLATLGGIQGTFERKTGTVDKYLFTRTTSGSETIVPAGSKVLPVNGLANRQAVTILNIGKNDLTGNITGAATLAQVTQWSDEAYDWLGALGRFTLVLGHFVDTNTPAVDSSRTNVQALNAHNKARYAGRFIDLYAYLTGPQVWTDTGITPTSTDLAQQAIGNKPPSLSSDDLHLNAAGYAAVRALISAKLLELGWGTGTPPVYASDDFNRADSTTIGTTPVGAKTWTASGAGFAIVSNELSCAGITTNRQLYVDAGVANYKVSSKIKAIGSTAATMAGGLIVRYIDANNYFWLSTRQDGTSTGLKFYQYNAGVVTAVGPASALVPVAGDTLMVESTPTELIVTLNDVEVMRYATTLHASGTKVGYMGHTAGTASRWDDFKVSA